MAIAFNPKFEYVAVDVGRHVYIVAAELLQRHAPKNVRLGGSRRSLATFPGAKLERAVFRHPFLDRDSSASSPITSPLEQGTGAVHTAPGHGQEDYAIGQQVRPRRSPAPSMPPAASINHERAGTLPTNSSARPSGKANPIVIEILRERGALLAPRQDRAQLPALLALPQPTHLPRHRAVVHRHGDADALAEADADTFRQRALDAIKRVNWDPSWGEERISNMIATRPDWCISRQRVWGVPIIVFLLRELPRAAHRRRRSTSHRRALRQAKPPTSGTATTPPNCCRRTPHARSCGSKEFRKEIDILDVWFDSGSRHLAVLEPEPDLQFPADMYLEGGDQYRGWFQSSLLVAVGLRDTRALHA